LQPYYQLLTANFWLCAYKSFILRIYFKVYQTFDLICWSPSATDWLRALKGRKKELVVQRGANKEKVKDHCFRVCDCTFVQHIYIIRGTTNDFYQSYSNQRIQFVSVANSYTFFAN